MKNKNFGCDLSVRPRCQLQVMIAKDEKVAGICSYLEIDLDNL